MTSVRLRAANRYQLTSGIYRGVDCSILLGLHHCACPVVVSERTLHICLRAASSDGPGAVKVPLMRPGSLAHRPQLHALRTTARGGAGQPRATSRHGLRVRVRARAHACVCARAVWVYLVTAGLKTGGEPGSDLDIWGCAHHVMFFSFLCSHLSCQKVPTCYYFLLPAPISCFVLALAKQQRPYSYRVGVCVKNARKDACKVAESRAYFNEI